VKKKPTATKGSESQDRKIVIDTNVILFDALAINKFQNADIYIPFIVIEEIDRFKRDLGENGRNARQFSRFMDLMRAQGSLAEGVKIEKTNSKVFVTIDNMGDALGKEFDVMKADNRILGKAMQLQRQYPSASVELVTKDINLRIKADVYGLTAVDYRPESSDVEELYEGSLELSVNPEMIDMFYKEKSLQLPEEIYTPIANQYLIMRDSSNENHSAIGRYDQKLNRVVPLVTPAESIWGIHPRNVEQSFALDCLLNDEILFVSLVGKAGTGKTLLALAAGLYKTLDEGHFHRLLVSRPIFPMGRDIGYLPGDVEQKLNPWMQPIFDNIEFLMGSDKKAAGRARELINQGMVLISAVARFRTNI
jgi:PhoH-like ATPase